MFRLQAQQLATARVGSLASRAEPLRPYKGTLRSNDAADIRAYQQAALDHLSAEFQRVMVFSLAKTNAQNNSVFDLWQNVVTACGPLEHDTDGSTIDLRGNSGPHAGQSGDHAILEVTQENPLAGTSTNPYLYSAIFNGPVKFSHPPRGVVRIATATANWVNAVHPAIPTVAATDDEDGTVLSIRLYRPGPSVDPNVRSGYQLGYMLDVNGNAVGMTGYLDDKIGMVKLWTGAVIDIPAGWQLADGTNGTPNLQDRFIVGAGNTYAVDATGGAAAHVHPISGATANTALAISVTVDNSSILTTDGTAVTINNATLSTNSGGTLTTNKATASLTLGSSGVLTTTFEVTGITINNAASGIVLADHTLTTDFAGTEVTAVLNGPTTLSHSLITDSHTHAITEPNTGTGHQHSIDTHTHTLTEPNAGLGHEHTIASHVHTIPDHNHTSPSHTHSLAAHAHTASASVADHGHAAGTLAADSTAHLPPYYALAFIVRID